MKRHTIFFGLALVITTTLIFAGCDALAGEAEASITSFTSDTYNNVFAGNQLTFTVKGSVKEGAISSSDTVYNVTVKLYVDGKEALVKDISRAKPSDFSQKMTIKFVEPGVKKLTVSVFNAKGTESTYSKSLTITVKESVTATGISLNNSSLTIKKSESKTLIASITPSSLDYLTVTWKSDDETKATVNDSGKVTGVSKGITTITASTSNGKKATCEVTVTAEDNPPAEDTPPKGSTFDTAYYYPLYSNKTERSVTLNGNVETFYYINLTDSYTKLNFAKDSKFVNGITLKLYNDKEKLLETANINEDESKGSYSLKDVAAGKYYIGIKHSYLSTVTGNFYIWKN